MNTTEQSGFQFKQFFVRHDRCAMRVGTDGVLLGAWAEMPANGAVLDVGCGSGLIALMCAQRCDRQIYGVEIDAAAADQAKENVAASPFAERVHIFQDDFTNFRSPLLFETIVSNPPYFNNSLKAPTALRSIARHTDTLSFETFVQRAYHLSTPTASLQLILPISEEKRFFSACCGLFFLTRRTIVRTKSTKAPKRVLLHFSKLEVPLVEDELILMTENNTHSEAYQFLTSAFYL